MAIDSRHYCAARNALEHYREKLMAIQQDNSAMAGGIVVQQVVTANAQNISELAAKFTKEERLEDLLYFNPQLMKYSLKIYLKDLKVSEEKLSKVVEPYTDAIFNIKPIRDEIALIKYICKEFFNDSS